MVESALIKTQTSFDRQYATADGYQSPGNADKAKARGSQEFLRESM